MNSANLFFIIRDVPTSDDSFGEADLALSGDVVVSIEDSFTDHCLRRRSTRGFTLHAPNG